MSGRLKKVIGITGDRVYLAPGDGRATDPRPNEVVGLYVNGGGQLLALTDEQVSQRGFGLGNGEPPNQPGSDAA